MVGRNEQAQFDLINDTRKFEIDLFWRRSLFFGGFISIIFVGYTRTSDDESLVKFLLAVLGFISSIVWTLANRGSKYWQENWEGHIAPPYSELFDIHYRKIKKEYFGAARYSPSRLAIALSSYITVIWAIIILSIVIPTGFSIILQILFMFVSLYFLVKLPDPSKSDKERVWQPKNKVWEKGKIPNLDQKL